MNFLELALQYIARGWYVHPLRPGTKLPIIKGWPENASVDEKKVREWWEQNPLANIGIACGLSKLLVMDADHGLASYEDFIAWRDRNGIPVTYTVRSGRRPEFGVQMYFIGSMRGTKFELDGVKGEIRSAGEQVVAVGSVHPDSKEKYALLVDAELAYAPAAINSWIVKHVTDGKGFTGEKITSNRNEELVRMIGKARHATHFPESAILAMMLEANADVFAVPLPEDEVRECVAKQFRQYPYESPTPGVIIGGKKSESATVSENIEVVEELDEKLKATPLPKYPLHVWAGTLYLEFAKRAREGNFIPLEFFVEGAMTCAGAVVGNLLRGFSEEITARMYTVLLGLAGAGKGTTFRRIRSFIPPSRLVRSVKEGTRPPDCSAISANPASENGLNDALLQHPACLLSFEELDKLMEKTRIQGSGQALMSIIRGLFDDYVPEITTCKGRPVAAELGYVSMLGAMTPNLWRRSMEGQDSYGTGLGGRFNLVATHSYAIAESMMPMDMGDVHEELDRKFASLEMRPQMSLRPTPEAFQVIKEWWAANYNGQQHYNRINVIAHRKALHLAWIRGSEIITAEHMSAALELAEYLVKIRDAFAVIKGEDKTAIGENRVLHILKEIQPKAVRSSKIVELLDGIMSRSAIYSALRQLTETGEVEEIAMRGDATCKKPYKVFRLSPKSALSVRGEGC